MLIYLITVLISYILSRMELYIPSGLILIIGSIYLFIREINKSNSFINLRAVFLLSFAGGLGVSALKLSYLQKPWTNKAWLCFLLAVIGFYYAYELGNKFIKNKYIKINKSFDGNRLFKSIAALSLISIVSLFIETVILGYLPFFVRGVPHAYSEFHITGLHYLTISCVLVPSLSVIYIFSDNDSKNILKDKKKVFCIVLSFIALLIPILLVSRFQFIFAVMLACISFMLIKNSFSYLNIVAVFIIILPVYIILTIARSHDIEYLNSIFEMRRNFPIFVSQPYIYIANNYDNFDTLVRELPKHSYGLKMLFPVWALSGLKFINKSLVDFPIYVTKTELTTVTLFYDAYYDFGIIGVTLFAGIIGFVSSVLEALKSKNIIFYFIYSQVYLYLGLAFFTTWFSNPTTWFLFILSIIITVYCLNFNFRSIYDFKKNEASAE